MSHFNLSFLATSLRKKLAKAMRFGSLCIILPMLFLPNSYAFEFGNSSAFCAKSHKGSSESLTLSIILDQQYSNHEIGVVVTDIGPHLLGDENNVVASMNNLYGKPDRAVSKFWKSGLYEANLKGGSCYKVSVMYKDPQPGYTFGEWNCATIETSVPTNNFNHLQFDVKRTTGKQFIRGYLQSSGHHQGVTKINMATAPVNCPPSSEK